MNLVTAQHKYNFRPRFSRRKYGSLAVCLLLIMAAAAPRVFGETIKYNNLTADRHKEKGVSCEACHGDAKEKTWVSSERCLGCHGPAAALMQKTAAVKPENPHDSPHWGARLDCAVCHRQHRPAVNWCANCHAFKSSVP